MLNMLEMVEWANKDFHKRWKKYFQQLAKYKCKIGLKKLYGLSGVTLHTKDHQQVTLVVQLKLTRKKNHFKFSITNYAIFYFFFKSANLSKKYVYKHHKLTESYGSKQHVKCLLAPL